VVKNNSISVISITAIKINIVINYILIFKACVTLEGWRNVH